MAKKIKFVPKKKLIQSCFDKGIKDHAKNISRCPYTKGTIEADSWISGWQYADALEEYQHINPDEAW